jgi:multidrug/hemolysin transport system ATP-binding protein
MITGQLRPDNGRIIVDGEDIGINDRGSKEKIGVVFQSSVLDSALSVRDNLESRGALYGMWGEELETRIEELADLLDFKDLLKRPVGKLSGGQRRRIDIARALLHRPKILILDEPTTGLDPKTRKLLWSIIYDLKVNEGMTVLLTTHYMEEAADADYVVIIDSGKISAEGTPLELKNRYTGDYITLFGITESEAEKLGKPYSRVGGGYRVTVPSTGEAKALILTHPEIFRDYEITKGKMDDVFLSCTGRALEEDEK